jgi:hypothetical protein
MKSFRFYKCAPDPDEEFVCFWLLLPLAVLVLISGIQFLEQL